VQEPLSETQDAECSMSSKFTLVYSSMVPRVMGKYGPPSSNPVLDKAKKLSLGGHLVDQVVPFETDSPTAIRPIGTALTPLDWGFFFKVYSFCSA